MQSDGTGFRGDVVLDGVDMTFRDEDNILDQIYANIFGLLLRRFIFLE